ncbi:MAG: phosphoglucosamine mutase [Planctomycetes bacterium]|nr:phosphoglucosamine mutase [Planctomycetota bacterium]
MAELMVSVSGIRGIVGETMTPDVAARFAAAFGTLIGPGRIVLGRDSRTSGRAVAAAVASGLLFTGCEVIDLGIATTPGVTVMIDELQADGGVMVTASHNPKPWNGIKFFRADGIDLAADQGARLKDIWQSGRFKYVGSDGFRQLKHDDTVHSRHMARVLTVTNRQAVAGRRLKVVLDACHGAGAIVTPQLLSELGCEVTVIGGQPDGLFEHPPEPIVENLKRTCETVRAVGADIGLVQDPDADRLALIDERGRFISEEYTLALAAMYRLEQQAGPVAANLSTSRMIDDAAARHGQVCHRTPVGEVHVADKMVAEGCVIGGEGNGGVIDPRICPIRNSLAGIGLILELIAVRGKPLSEIAAELPAYTMIKRKSEAPREAIQKLLEVLPSEFAEARIDTQDGVRMDWPEGWIHVRASNTEPIYRMIGESTDAAWIEAMLAKVAALAGRLVK